MLPSSRVPAAAPDPDASTQLARAAARLLFAGALIAAMPAHAQDQADWDSDLDSLLGEPPSQDEPPRNNEQPVRDRASEPSADETANAAPKDEVLLDVIPVPTAVQQPELPAPPRRATLEEIVVTAQKREENIQSVPLSVTAISGDDIVDKNMGDMNEVATYVPNLDVFATPSFPSIYMRGLGSSYNRGFEQSVAILIDDVYYGRASYINQATLDLAGIEVLRGPQGTLFGKNASAGAIHFRTAMPEPQFGFKGDVLLGDLDQQRVRLTATGPITETLTWRAAVLSETRDGSVYNTTIGIDEENHDTQAGRLRFLWEATDALSVDLILNAGIIRQHGEGSQLIRARDRHLAAMQVFDPRTSADPFDELTAKNSQGRVARDAYDATLKADWTLDGDYVLTSITNYTWLDEKVRMDADFSPIPFLILDNDEALQQYSQELRITSPPGEFEFVGGLFYMRSDLQADYNIREFLMLTELLQVTGELERSLCLQTPDPQSCQDLALNDAVSGRLAGELIQARQTLEGGPTPVETEFTRFDQLTDSVALFGQATWHFSDRWSATVGGRLNYEVKSLDVSHRLLNNRTGVEGNAVITGDACEQLLPIDLPVLGALPPLGNYCLGPSPLGSLIFPFIITGATQFEAQRERKTFNLIPKLSLQHDFDDAAMAYFTVAQGYKSGGFTGQPVNDIGLEFEDEEALTWELGAKSEWLGGAARLNASLFYTDFEDLQVSTFNGVAYVVENAASAEIYGLEYEGMLMTPYGILLGLNGALTHAEYSEFNRAACTAEDTRPPPCDLTGRRLRLVPDVKATFTAGWEGAPFNWPFLTRIGVTASYTSEVALATDLDPIDVRVAGTTYGVQLGIKSHDDTWHVTLFGDNVTGRQSLAAAQDSPGFRGTHFGGAYLDATYEIELGYRF
ncbi:MAG: TonB-dependent receptor [Pseudomonadota bacterium]|nr:TonB-dependent receptor [Pseudomonadota bacterium]